MGKTVLITGGSGYLGQFLVEELGKTNKVGYTHYSTAALPPFEGDVKAYWVDLKTGEGLTECLKDLGPLDVVINCAAISQPAVCERDIDYARQCNVPRTLLHALQQHKELHHKEPLLVHISTDQVYDGSKAFWKEDDPCNPVNGYGVTKREAELLIQEEWPHHVILRSSIIYGPQSPAPVARTLFLQFMDNALGSGKATSFFEDEFRCPIYVRDIVHIVDKLVQAQVDLSHERLFNMGGPQRLSRVDMASMLATARGYDTALILPVPAASVDRGVKSPPDISMDIMRLMGAFQLAPFTFMDALHHMNLSPESRGE